MLQITGYILGLTLRALHSLVSSVARLPVKNAGSGAVGAILMIEIPWASITS